MKKKTAKLDKLKKWWLFTTKLQRIFRFAVAVVSGGERNVPRFILCRLEEVGRVLGALYQSLRLNVQHHVTLAVVGRGRASGGYRDEAWLFHSDGAATGDSFCIRLGVDSDESPPNLPRWAHGQTYGKKAKMSVFTCVYTHTSGHEIRRILHAL